MSQLFSGKDTASQVSHFCHTCDVLSMHLRRFPCHFDRTLPCHFDRSVEIPSLSVNPSVSLGILERTFTLGGLGEGVKGFFYALLKVFPTIVTIGIGR